MEPKKTLVCTCENCGNEAEMTIKCEEVVLEQQAGRNHGAVGSQADEAYYHLHSVR